jgi:hypothetical protein
MNLSVFVIPHARFTGYMHWLSTANARSCPAASEVKLCKMHQLTHRRVNAQTMLHDEKVHEDLIQHGPKFVSGFAVVGCHLMVRDFKTVIGRLAG